MRFSAVFLFSVLVVVSICNAEGPQQVKFDQTILTLLTEQMWADGTVEVPFIETYQRSEDNWLIEQYRLFEPSGGVPSVSIPFINLAGYLDTDLSWEEGGQFTMLAHVTDADSDVESVEVYWDGQPTGLFLYDDGSHGDFGPSDGLWGITFSIEPYTLPSGEYLLELRAKDSTGNYSDIWPYLTIHP